MGDVPCGAAVAQVKNNSLFIFHVSVAENYRRKGVCTALLAECSAHAKSAGLDCVNLCLTLSSNKDKSESDFFPVFLEKIGFKAQSSRTTVTVRVSDSSKAEWRSFSEGRGGRILKSLTAKGFGVKSFGELESNSQVLEKLYAMMSGEFSSSLDPRNRFNKMLKSNSFVTVKNEIPVAYSIVTSADDGKTAILEYMSTAGVHIGTGVFLPCLMASIESILQGDKCGSIAFTHNDDNRRMKNLIQGTFTFMDMSVRKTLIYSKIFKEEIIMEQQLEPRELSEQDLEGASGGATRNRYDKDNCPKGGFREWECRRTHLFDLWCDHLRQKIVPTSEKKTGYKWIQVSCAMNCFTPFTEWWKYTAVGEVEQLN